MRIVPAIEEKLKREVRAAIARDPLITITGLQQHLQHEFNREFSFVYVRKLMNKVVGQASSELSRARINDRIIQLRQTHEIARERLMHVLYWKPEMRDQGIRQPKPE